MGIKYKVTQDLYIFSSLVTPNMYTALIYRRRWPPVLSVTYDTCLNEKFCGELELQAFIIEYSQTQRVREVNNIYRCSASQEL